jgi:hypothetical protein
MGFTIEMQKRFQVCVPIRVRMRSQIHSVARGFAWTFGMNPIDVSSHEPQLQPPPPSGESSIPMAGMVLIQQSGRTRFNLVEVFFSRSHIVMSPARKKIVLSVQV